MRRSIFFRMDTLGGTLVLAVVLVGAVAAQADDLSNPTHPDQAL